MEGCVWGEVLGIKPVNIYCTCMSFIFRLHSQNVISLYTTHSAFDQVSIKQGSYDERPLKKRHFDPLDTLVYLM